MGRSWKKVFILLLLIIFFSFFVKKTFSQICKNTEECQKIISESESKIKELSQQRDTLSSQIQYMDTQIYLTELKISQTEIKINEIKEEINQIEKRISGLDQSINYLANLLIRRVLIGYKNRHFSLLNLLFENESASLLINQYKYWKSVQEENQRLLIKTQQSKLNLEEQKSLREEKITQLNNLQKQLAAQKTELAQQKTIKQKLLIETQNSEAVYQKLLADALRELSQIQKAASFLKNQGTAVFVKKGDVIGVQGNTGYSFGDHLHFGVYRYSSIDDLVGDWYGNNWVDPGSVLSQKQVLWDTGCESKEIKTVGSGSFSWPIENPTISQGSGFTCYSSLYYRGRVHPAWDMWGPTGTLIRAAEDGNAYFCRNCLGDGANGVFIFHDNGLMTLYWHLQ